MQFGTVKHGRTCNVSTISESAMLYDNRILHEQLTDTIKENARLRQNNIELLEKLRHYIGQLIDKIDLLIERNNQLIEQNKQIAEYQRIIAEFQAKEESS